MKNTDNLNENVTAAAEPAEAEKESVAATELGKFKSVKALLDAYTSLEAEFTRRSQRLKELESAANAAIAPAEAVNAERQPCGQQDGDSLIQAALNSEEVKNAVICEYLKRASENKCVPLMAGGTSVPAPKKAPSTVKEAGQLARDFLNKGEFKH